DHLQVSGGIIGDSSWLPVYLRVEDRDGHRRITGSLAYREVNVHLYSDGVVGYIGRFGFALAQQDDALVGRVRSSISLPYRLTLTMQGRNALWQMPAADQAAALTLMIPCLLGEPGWNFRQRDPHPVTFGGPTNPWDFRVPIIGAFVPD